MARKAKKSDVRFQIELDPDPAAFAKSHIMGAAALGDFRSVFRSMVVGLLGANMVDNIDSRGSLIGESFPDQGDTPYERRKSREGFGRKQFVETGDIRRTLSTSPFVAMRMRKVSVGLKEKDAIRAASVNFGFRGGPRPHPIGGVNPKAQAKILAAVEDYVNSVMRKIFADVGSAII